MNRPELTQPSADRPGATQSAAPAWRGKVRYAWLGRPRGLEADPGERARCVLGAAAARRFRSAYRQPGGAGPLRPALGAGARKVLLRWGGPASIKTAAMELLDDLIPKSDPSDRP